MTTTDAAYRDPMAELTWTGWQGMNLARIADSTEWETWETRVEQLTEGTPVFAAACRRLNRPVFDEHRRFDHAGELAGDPLWLGDGLALVPFFGVEKFHDCGAGEDCGRYLHHHRGAGGRPVECDDPDCPVDRPHGHVTQAVYVAKCTRETIASHTRHFGELVRNPRFRELRGGVDGPSGRLFRTSVWVPESVTPALHDVDDADQVMREWAAEHRQAMSADGFCTAEADEILVDPDVLWKLRSATERDGVDMYEALLG